MWTSYVDDLCGCCQNMAFIAGLPIFKMKFPSIGPELFPPSGNVQNQKADGAAFSSISSRKEGM